MIIRQKYTPDSKELLSWDELKIGDVYYHMCTKKVNMKTSKIHMYHSLIRNIIQEANYCKVQNQKFIYRFMLCLNFVHMILRA